MNNKDAITPIDFNQYVKNQIEKVYDDKLLLTVFRVKSKQKSHILLKDAIEQCRQIYNYEMKNNLIKLKRFVDVHLDRPLSSTIIDTYHYPIPEYKRKNGLTYREIEEIFGFSMIVPNKEDRKLNKFAQFNMTTDNIFELTGNIEYYFTFKNRNDEIIKYVNIEPPYDQIDETDKFIKLYDVSNTLYQMMKDEHDAVTISLHKIKYSAYVKGQDFGETQSFIEANDLEKHVFSIGNDINITFPITVTYDEFEKDILKDIQESESDDSLDIWYNNSYFIKP